MRRVEVENREKLNHQAHRNIHPNQRTYLCKQLLETSLDRRGVGAADGFNFLPVLQEEESGHGRDAVLRSDLLQLVDVDLVELDVGMGLAQLLNLRSDGLAGPAPLSEEIDKDGIGGIKDLGLELLGATGCNSG